MPHCKEPIKCWKHGMKSGSKLRKDSVDSLCFKHGLYMYHDISSIQPLRVLPPDDI